MTDHVLGFIQTEQLDPSLFKGSLHQVSLLDSLHNEDVLQRTVKSSFRITSMYCLSVLPLYCLEK